jgi:hypothetical protein
LWPGIFTSRVGDGSESEWRADEIVRQIEVTRKQSGATGNIHFSIKALAADRDGLTTKLRKGLYAEPALVPASPWLTKPGEQPAAPQLSWAGPGDNRKLVLQLPGGNPPWLWVIRHKHSGDWTTKIVPGHVREWDFASTAADSRPEEYAGQLIVSAVNRAGIEGPRSVIPSPVP